MGIRIAQYAAKELTARPEEYELHLVHVTRTYAFEEPAVGPADEPPDVVLEGKELEVSFVKLKLLPIVKQWYQDSRAVLIHTRRIGPSGTGKAICNYAKEQRASMVVIGTRNRHFIIEFFGGSVTHYCTHHCTQPLLLLH
ncbi:hypothetical protein WJX72_009128 [[Myrmecia] bisecta]|uniref:UspA domain-containing protein n=1 Tax=[Myrmecia] bisecta TaxID=41462 RepID=A0AAW1PG55_9CHLO